MKNTTIALGTILLAALYLGGCSDEAPVGPGCDDLGAGAKVTTVLRTADRLDESTAALDADLAASCEAIGNDLSLTPPAPAEGESEAEATCGAVAAEIESILTASLPSGASLVIDVAEPSCRVDVGAFGDCVAECDASLMGSADVMCTEGELSGTCTGTCDGSCAIDGMVTCAAECRGTCDGTCTGTCTGTCMGTCSATTSSGDCAGTCDGTCMGTCSADCTGTCDGTCVTEVSGTCMGTCSGACDVAFEEPRCDGEAEIMADADCEAACDVEVQGDVVCTEPSVTITTSAPVDLSADDQLATLIASLHRHYPAFLATEARVEGTLAAAEAFVTSIQGLADGSSEIGAQASACLTVAATTAADASARVSGSVEASASVSASVSVSGTASP